ATPSQAESVVVKTSPRCYLSSIEHILNDGIDQAGGNGYEYQITTGPVPFIAGVMRQVAYMLMGQALTPTVRNRAAGDQASMGRQRGAAPDMMPVLVYLPAQLTAVRYAMLVALL